MTSENGTDPTIAALFGAPPPDGGFSARVMARLPQRRNPWRRLWLAAVAFAGAAPTLLPSAAAGAQSTPAVSAAALALAALMALVWLAAEAATPALPQS